MMCLLPAVKRLLICVSGNAHSFISDPEFLGAPLSAQYHVMIDFAATDQGGHIKVEECHNGSTDEAEQVKGSRSSMLYCVLAPNHDNNPGPAICTEAHIRVIK
jgi:hypothetical protein